MKGVREGSFEERGGVWCVWFICADMHASQSMRFKTKSIPLVRQNLDLY